MGEVGSSEHRIYWMNFMEKEGAEKTYEHFLDTANDLPETKQHFASHIIGDVLYETQGIDGVTVCDSQFGFGCFHGFFSAALSRDSDAVSKLNSACVGRFGELGTGCMHGIGHGILEYEGYDHVAEALDHCKETTQLIPILGCTSGVFMEYFTPLTETADGGLATVSRKVDTVEPFSVCSGVRPEYKASCFFELGSWWAVSSGRNWSDLKGYCRSLPDGENKDFCFLGIGYAHSNMEKYNTDKAKAECATLPERPEAICVAGASWSMYANPEYRNRAEEMCSSLNSLQKEECTYFSRPDMWGDVSEI